MVTAGVADLADARMAFPANPAGVVTVGVVSLVYARMVTIGVTDLANARVASLADDGTAFPADLAGVVTVGGASLADAGMVTVGMADLADAGMVFPANPVGVVIEVWLPWPMLGWLL